MKYKLYIIILNILVLILSDSNKIRAQTFEVPSKPFGSYQHPPEPDYSKPYAWAAMPDTIDSADIYPINSAYKNMQDSAQADVFYIHPTTYRNANNWNQDINSEKVNNWTDISVIARQASIFNACCKIYAPRYRQAAFGAVGSKDGSGMKAYNFAYKDVLKSWRYYRKYFNKERPFFLVGHSQGALHAFKLLHEEIDQSLEANQIIAAYIVGIGITVGMVKNKLKNISICKNQQSIKCIISWNTFDKDFIASQWITRTQERYYNEYQTRRNGEIICWNPTQQIVNKQPNGKILNIGALAGSPKYGKLDNLVSGYKAYCQNGVLYTFKPVSRNFKIMSLPGGSLHMHDMDLFYENLRETSVKQTSKYLIDKKL